MSTLPGIDMNVFDGGLALAPNVIGGIAGVIGQATLGDDAIHLITSVSQIATLYGTGPLPRALRDALESGAKMLVACRISSLDETEAIIEDPERTATGLGIGPVVAGEGNTSPACAVAPTTPSLPGAGSIEVKITTAGVLGVGAFSFRVNGGAWSEPAPLAAVVPCSFGEYGFVLTFAAGAYILADTWSAPIVAGGSGAIVATGTPLADAVVVVEITTTGGRNEGRFKVSVNGAPVLSAMTIPANGQIDLPGLCVLTFNEGAGAPPHFVDGDTWSVVCTAAAVGVVHIGDAALKIRAAGLPVECIHVVGATSPSTWAAMDVLAETEFAAKGRFMHFLCEATDVAPGDTESDWAADRVGEPVVAGSLKRVTVCAGYVDAAPDRRSIGGRYLGHLMGLKKLSYSPGRVKSGSIAGVTEFGPVDEGIIAQLDAAGFTTFRRWDGLSGAYVTNGRMLVDETSDFRWVEYRRVMDSACRVVRLAGLRSAHDEGDAAGLTALEADMQVPLDRMIAARLCAGAQTVVPEGQDVVGTGTVAASVSVQPMPAMRWITVDIGFSRGETA